MDQIGAVFAIRKYFFRSFLHQMPGIQYCKKYSDVKINTREDHFMYKA